MAESTLTIDYVALAENVGFFLGYGYNSTVGEGLTQAQVDEIDLDVQSGYRMFLFPPAAPPMQTAYQWEWLHPLASVTMWATATGTADAALTTTVTATTATFFSSMIGHSIVFASGTAYTITGYTSSTVITVDTTAVADSSTTFTITATGSYRLPDNFGGMFGQITFDSNAGYYVPLQIVSEKMVRESLQYSTTTARPGAATVRGTTYDATTGQRYDMVVFPIPDVDYTANLRYTLMVDKLDTTNKYPLGGMMHGETIKAACLAAAEVRTQNTKGAMFSSFMERLKASVDQDKMTKGPDTLGIMTDPGVRHGGGVHERLLKNTSVTHNGVSYP